jgi:mRNA interferase HigB
MLVGVRVIARRILRQFWSKHADARQPLKAWYDEVKKALWGGMVDIKKSHATASVVDRERVVFNIGGNKYRLVVKLWFPSKTVFIKFVGTHEQYDRIDVDDL